MIGYKMLLKVKMWSFYALILEEKNVLLIFALDKLHSAI